MATRTINLGVVSAAPITRNSIRIGNTNVQFTGGAQSYLQFFTTTISATNGQPVAPNSGASPVQTFILYPGIENVETFDENRPLIPGPVYAALSSTAATYTALTANSSIILEVEEWEEELPSNIQTASASTAKGLMVWTNAQAPHLLYDVFVVNGSATAQYLMLFSTDNRPTTGTIPDESNVWLIPGSGSAGVNINVNGGLLLNFGNEQDGGITITQQGGLLATDGIPAAATSTALNGQPGTGTVLQGCFLAISAAPAAGAVPTLSTASSATGCTIIARYV